MTLRLLQVMAGAESGGAETAFIDMVLALHERGVRQHVVTRTNDRLRRLDAAGVPYTCLPFGGAIDLYTPYQMRKILRTFRPEVVQTWMSRAAAKTPAWESRMGIPRYLKICRLGGYYKLKYYRGADYFIAITPDIKRYLVDQGVPETRVFHINNFADVEEAHTPMTRAQMGTPEDAPLIVTLGRLHTAKAFDTLIRAVVDLPSVHVWIGGAGPEESALQDLITSQNLSDRVKLCGWVDDRAAFLSCGDICVFPSRYEPFGTVFVQAWACRIPLITSLADGPRQYVREGVDALTFDIDDVSGLQRQIQYLLDHPEVVESLTRAGAARYEQEFTKDRTRSAYLDLYDRLLGQKAAA